MGKFKLNIGDVYLANCGDYCKVVERLGSNQVVIEWQDEFKHRQISKPNNVMNGRVHNPYNKTSFGVGYIGHGLYKPAKDKLQYSIWRCMFVRCYSQDYHEWKPTYSDVTVASEWYNFQNFAQWCNDTEGFGLKGYQLDKDLIVKGNRIYSPETCCFVPSYINSLFSSSQAIRGELPIGVHQGKPMLSGKETFLAQVKNKKFSGDGPIHLGTYSNKEDAHKAWQKAKAIIIKNTLDIYLKEQYPNEKVMFRLQQEYDSLIYNSENGIETKSFYTIGV